MRRLMWEIVHIYAIQLTFQMHACAFFQDGKSMLDFTLIFVAIPYCFSYTIIVIAMQQVCISFLLNCVNQRIFRYVRDYCQMEWLLVRELSKCKDSFSQCSSFRYLIPNKNLSIMWNLERSSTCDPKYSSRHSYLRNDSQCGSWSGDSPTHCFRLVVSCCSS